MQRLHCLYTTLIVIVLPITNSWLSVSESVVVHVLEAIESELLLAMNPVVLDQVRFCWRSVRRIFVYLQCPTNGL